MISSPGLTSQSYDGKLKTGGNSWSQTCRPQRLCGWCWWCWCDVGRNWGGGGGKNSSESDTQGPARWAKVPLSLSPDKSGWNMQRCAFCKMQRRLQTRKRSEMELNRRGTLQGGGGKSTFEVRLSLQVDQVMLMLRLKLMRSKRCSWEIWRVLRYLLFMASFKGELLPNVKFEIDRLCGAWNHKFPKLKYSSAFIALGSSLQWEHQHQQPE